MRVVQLVAICQVGCERQGCEHVLQEISLPTAESKGNSWTPEELKFLLDTTDESLTEVARALGRTYYATSKTRSLVRRGLLKV